MRKYWFFALLLMFVATAAETFGACHAVGPSAAGNGSGSDWNNRMGGLPTTLVRGDAYYLMDGSYGSYAFTTPNSGSTPIIVKKAQKYDYGRASDGCSNDISTGWNAGTMGGGQAAFTRFDTGANGRNYFVLDGNGAATGPGCGTSPVVNTFASDCGIKITSGSSDDGPFDLGAYNSFASGVNNWTIRYVEVQGGGDNISVEQNGIWCRDGCSNLLIEHVWWHEIGTDFIKLPHSTSATIRYSHFKQNSSSSSYHGQFYMSEAGASNVSFYGNVIQDIQGTAIWTFNTGGRPSNVLVYNNVILYTNGSSRPGTSNGIFACINSGSVCTNIRFIGNTVINGHSDYSGAFGIRDENGSGSWVWQNNLFYATQANAVGFSTRGSTFTEDHNSWLNSGSPASGAADVTVSSGAPNPFVNWTGYDFHLATQNAYWSTGAILPAPYNVDLAGNSRPGSDGAWNRGAFEYGGSQQQEGPIPPSTLTTMVK